MSQKETSAVGAKTCPAIEMRGITKIYPNGVVANQGVDFSVNYGEIHAVMGENGAGKSTLMKMLFGMERPDQGEILFEGKPVQIHSPADAIALHIGMVHQEFMLVPSLTVAENMVLREEPLRGGLLSTTPRPSRPPGRSLKSTACPSIPTPALPTCL